MRKTTDRPGGDDMYRKLYEGSQASLSDMARRQASALGRVASLRAAIVDALKQTFPEQFNDAEHQLGRRMTAVEDDVLLAYLNAFLTTARMSLASAGAPEAGLQQLRAALATAGFKLPSSDSLSEWADAVTTGRPTAALPATTPEPAAAPAATPKSGAGMPYDAPYDAPDEPPPDGPQPNYSGLDLADLFDDAPAAPGPLPGGGLDDLFADGPRIGPADGDADPDVLVASLFDRDVAAPDARGSGPGAGPSLGDRAPRMTRRPPEVVAEPETVTGPQTVTEPEKVTELPAAPAPASTSIWEQSDSSPVRPTLFPAAQVPKGPRKRPARQPRVSATRPGDGGLDVPAQPAPSGQLTNTIAEQLVAAVCVPRPVFLRDLVAQVGSAEQVAEWKERCFSDTAASPVRFVFPKPRHASGLEDLVVPYKPELRDAADGFAQSFWATCLKELRGSQLYEVAALLHRFGERVISSKIDGRTVVLRVNEPRGLVGVVIAMSDDLDPGDATRKKVASGVRELLADRLSMVAVLTTSGRRHSVDNLARAVKEDAEVGGWTETTPIVASQTWDFASAGGSSALAVR